jgi:hypothetical protein
VLATQTESAAARDFKRESGGTPTHEDRLGWVERTRYQGKFNAMESVTTFLAVCRAAGCKKEELFTPADLLENRDAERVAGGLLALKTATASRGGGGRSGENDPLVQTIRKIDQESTPRKENQRKNSSRTEGGNGRKRRSTGESLLRSLDEAETLEGGFGEVWPESPAGGELRPAFGGGGEERPQSSRSKRSDSMTSNSSAVSAYGSSLSALGVKTPEEFDTIRKFARRLASKDRVVKELTGAIQAANDREERMRARIEELSQKLEQGGEDLKSTSLEGDCFCTGSDF